MGFVYILIALVIGFAIGISLMFSKHKDLKLKHTTLIDKNKSTVQDNNQNILLNSQNQKLINNLDTDNKILRNNIENVSTIRDEKQQELNKKEKEISNLNRQLTQYSEAIGKQQGKKSQSIENVKTLEEAKMEMSKQFKSVAQDILEQRSQKMNDIQTERLNDVLKPFQDNIKEFKETINATHKADSQERGTLSHQINSLKELNNKMNQEAQNLTRALKGDKQKQGAWGEMILETVLENSGLVKNKHYKVQVHSVIKDLDSTKIIRPDIIVYLPKEKAVIVDSRVSLVAYEKYVNSDEPIEKQEYLQTHIKNIKAHIKSLSDKNYQEADSKSVEFILMFIPIESAFVAAFEFDNQVFNDAFRTRIIVVTPSTLLATLKTIHFAWSADNRDQNTREINLKVGKLLDKFTVVAKNFEVLGKNFKTASDTYDKIKGGMMTGNDNVVKQITKLKELGIETKKELPDSFKN